MTRKNLASTTTEASPTVLNTELLERLIAAAEAIAKAAPAVDSELKCYTPAQAAELLGKTENWVIESIQAGSIPFTRVGKSPRLTAAHIRWVQANGEHLPNKYAIKSAA